MVLKVRLFWTAGGGCLRPRVGLLRDREPVVVISKSMFLRTIARKNLRGSQLLDALASQPLAHVHADLEGLALENTSAETTSESVTARLSSQHNEYSTCTNK